MIYPFQGDFIPFTYSNGKPPRTASSHTLSEAAALQTAKAKGVLQTRPIPDSGPHEILVLKHAIAANHLDWKIQDYDFFVEKYPNVLGSDICGIVVELGEQVSHFKKGD